MRIYLGLAVFLLETSLCSAASHSKKHMRIDSTEEASVQASVVEEAFAEETAPPPSAKGQLASTPAIAPLDQVMLKDLAEGQGFGYKTANLQALETICSAFNKATSTPILVAVPSFMGISSHALQQALLREPAAPYYFNVQEEWARVISSVTTEEMRTALATKQFSPVFIAACEQFKQRLKVQWGHFVAHVGTSSLDTTFGIAGLDSFVALITEREALLMVRSTGKEDTTACANAGGNKSIACVAPTQKAILTAIGKVVRSYFSLKSLTQRLRLGDQTVFSPDIFTPVLLQQMVGEKSGKAIPRCGVMFTEDPESNNPLNPPNITTGISLIQAAYGHNEGVVNSLIPVDSYYAIQLATQPRPAIYPVIRKKTARLAPATSGGTALVRKNNPQKIQLHRALSEIELTALKAFADALEQYYGYAVDVEFVITGDTIFIVQARPIVHTTMHAPSYLQHDIPGTHFAGTTIGAAGGSVCIIENPTEAIIAPSINAALNEYLFNSAINPTAIKAIIIGEQAASTSHAATVFRNAGKPVIFLPQWPAVITELGSGKKILLSVQQNTAVATDAIDLSSLIKPGWITYPAPRCVSALPHLFGDNPASGAGSSATYRSTIATTDALKMPLARLIGMMKTETPDKVYLATQCFMEKWRQYAATKTLDKELMSDAKRLEDSLQIICQHVNNLAPAQPSAQHFMQRLLAVRMLESLTFQQFPRDEILQPLSLATLGKILKQETDVFGTGPDTWACPDITRPYYQQLKKIDTVIHAEAVVDTWHKVLRTAASQTTSKEIQRLAQIISKLTSMDVLPMWLHTTCYKNITEMGYEDIAGLLATWETDLASAKDFLTVTTKKQQLIREIKSNLAVFDAPKTFAPAWQHFKEQLLDVFISTDFLDSLKATTPLGRLVACATMHQLVDLNDEIIKTMKGSQAWGLSEKLATFKMALESSFQLLEAWTSLITETDVTKSYRDESSPIGAFMAVIKTPLSQKTIFRQNDLTASQGFDASAVTIGNATYLEPGRVQYPRTGEDIFMAIHQNQLAVVAILNAKYGGLAAEVPILLKQSLEVLANLSVDSTDVDGTVFYRRYPVNLVALHMNNASIEISGNTPLHHHSGKFTLTYYKDAPRSHVDVSIELFGRNTPRWEEIACAFVVQAALGHFTLLKVHTHTYGTSATIRLVNEAPLTILKGFVPDILDRANLIVGPVPLAYKNLTIEPFVDFAFLHKTVTAMEAFGSIGQRTALNLFIWLTNPLNKSLAITDASYNFMSDLAERGTASADATTRECAFNYFKQFIPMGHGYQQAFASANSAVLSTKDEVKRQALELFATLVEQGQALPEALAVAQANSSNVDTNVRIAALNLFVALVKKEFGIEEAVTIATDRGFVDDYIFDLIIALVGKGRCYELAEQVADKRGVIDLWIALVEQGQCLPQALTVALRNIANTNVQLRDRIHTLLSKLLEKKYGIQEIFEAAVNRSYPLKIKLDIFCLLVEKGYEYESAKIAAMATVQDRSNQVVESSLKLFTCLVKKGQAIPEAQHAAARHKNNWGIWRGSLQRELDRIGAGSMEPTRSSLGDSD